MLKVPQKYSRCGIKIKCLACKWQISEKCGMTKNKISSCTNKDKHRFNIVVVIPRSGGSRRYKIIETRNFEIALKEQIKFKEELKVHGYHRRAMEKTVSKTSIRELAAEYLDCISGESTHSFMNMKRSSDHVKEIRRVLERFLKSLKLRRYNLEILDVKDIGNDEVQIFHEYLLNELKLGHTTYCKHMVLAKAFYNFIIDKKDIKITNPFKHASLSFEKNEINVITKGEFEKLLKIITYESGAYVDGKKNRNYYQEWLKPVFSLALETGLRREELVKLKWSDLIQIEKSSLVFRINNLKVNRITNNSDAGTYIKHVPVTKSLKKLLVELGYNKSKNTDGYIIDRPEGTDFKFMMDTISRAFGHYIKQVTDRPIQFKDLRKTYISHMAIALGENLKLFTGHTNNETLNTHYISSAFVAGKLGDLSIF